MHVCGRGAGHDDNVFSWQDEPASPPCEVGSVTAFLVGSAVASWPMGWTLAAGKAYAHCKLLTVGAGTTRKGSGSSSLPN